MKVYRLTKTQYADDLSGLGAKLFGGRWNHIDTACIYTAESRALAILEYTVNINIEFIPKDLSICEFEIDESKISKFRNDELPSNWKEIPASYSTKNFGTKLLQNGTYLFQIPSVVVPEEFNYVLSPDTNHKHLKLVDIQPFSFDLRMQNLFLS